MVEREFVTHQTVPAVAWREDQNTIRQWIVEEHGRKAREAGAVPGPVANTAESWGINFARVAEIGIDSTGEAILATIQCDAAAAEVVVIRYCRFVNVED
jgi:hypothetical protein